MKFKIYIELLFELIDDFQKWKRGQEFETPMVIAGAVSWLALFFILIYSQFIPWLSSVFGVFEEQMVVVMIVSIMLSLMLFLTCQLIRESRASN